MVYDLAISKVPLRCLYSYTSHEPLEPGERVLIDFHGRKTVGYVVRASDRPADHSLKEITRRLDRASFLDQTDVEAIRIISEKFF